MKNLKKYTINYNETFNFISEKILSNNTRTVFVQKKNKIIGVITEGDILRTILSGYSNNLCADDIMSKSFKFLNARNKEQSKKIFKKFKITSIPILDNNMKLKDIIEPWEVM